MRFIRFDKISEKSVCLGTDKFGYKQPFPAKARCRFLQYVHNKPGKFEINFLLALDMQSKYLINGFSYWGKYELRLPGVPLNEYLVLHLVKNYANYGTNVTCLKVLQLTKNLLEKKVSLELCEQIKKKCRK